MSNPIPPNAELAELHHLIGSLRRCVASLKSRLASSSRRLSCCRYLAVAASTL